MYRYFFKRLLLIFPTLAVIMLLNFLIIQTAPGGPVEKLIAQLNHNKINGETFSSNHSNNFSHFDHSASIKYQGSQGIDEQIIKKIEQQYGFDLPLFSRFILMMKKYLLFDFGESFYQDKKISVLIMEKLPVLISARNFSIGPPGANWIMKKFKIKIINKVGKINKNLLKKYL